MIKTSEKQINSIAQKIGKIKSVEAVILFGSQSRGTNGPLSDIDVCIIEKEKSLVRKESSENLDITFFHELPISMQFRVLKEGKILINNQEKNISNLQKKVAKEYIDFKYLLNNYERRFLHV